MTEEEFTGRPPAEPKYEDMVKSDDPRCDAPAVPWYENDRVEPPQTWDGFQHFVNKYYYNPDTFITRKGAEDFSRDITKHTLAAFGIAGEAGEIVDLLKKGFFHNKKTRWEDLVGEIGDLLWYVALLMGAEGITFNEVAEHNFNKLKERHRVNYYKGGK